MRLLELPKFIFRNLRTGFVFLPTAPKSERRQPAFAKSLLTAKTISVDAVVTRHFNFGMGLSKDLGRGLFAGIAYMYDPDAEERRAGLVLTWKL